MGEPAKQATEPIIVYAGGAPFAVFCGVCKSQAWTLSVFALEAALGAARECCTLPNCKTCGQPMPNRGWCNPCRATEGDRRLAENFAAARKVPIAEYDGRMVNDGDDEFIHTGDVDPDSHTPMVVDGVSFFWGTSSEKASVDLERECRDNWLEEHHEDACDWVDFPKLEAAQQFVDEALAKVETFYPDASIAVVVATTAEEYAGD